jgi:hypothetical protein
VNCFLGRLKQFAAGDRWSRLGAFYKEGLASHREARRALSRSKKVKPTTSRPKPFRLTLKALYHAEITFPVNFPQMIQPT